MSPERPSKHRLLTDHLDIWTAADTAKKSGRGRSSGNAASVYGIKKLRELILELAVRGKLVPQDANDEPASELLKRIQVEKAKLIAEGRIKKDKPLPPIIQEEKPFELPQGWEWVRIAEVGHDWGQKTPDSVFTYIEVSAIDSQRGVVSTPELVDPENAPSRARKLVKKGSIIYSTVRPYLLNIAVIEQDFSPEPIASTAFAIVHPFCSMPSRYFLIFFRSPVFVRYVESVQTGIAYPAINDRQFFGGVVPLPPLVEQHRIVAKVDELMAMCDQLEQEQTDNSNAHQALVETLLATLTQAEGDGDYAEAWQRITDHFDTLFTTEQSIALLKQSILQLAVMGKLVPQDRNDEPAEALLYRVKAAREQLIDERKIRQSDDAELSKPDVFFDIPAGWIWAHVKDVAIVQGGKRLPNGVALLQTPTPHIYIRVTDMKNGTVLETGLMYLSPEVQRQISRYTINKEDLYITIAGTIGDIGVIPDSLDGQNLTENAAKIVFRILDKRFLQLALSSDFVQAQFLEKTKQMAQPKLALKRIAGAKFCLPPLNEQYRIVDKFDGLMAICDALIAGLNKAQVTQVQLADALVEQAVA
jgi:type I restriction enzyme S subunit